MKLWSVLLFAASFVACSSKRTQTESAQTPPAESRTDVVTLSAAAQKDSGIRTAEVSQEAIPEIIRATARLTNDENHTWRVGSIAEGRIVRIHANPGDLVRKGQVLAEVHSHDIHESRAQYKKAKADLARARGIAQYSLGLCNRAKRLLELKAGSIAQVEQAETEYQNALTGVRNAEIEENRTRTHLTEVLGIPAEESEIPPSIDGEDNDLIPIVSPAAGVVLRRNVTPGTVVSLSNDLFLVSDLTNLWAIAEVNEEHLSKLRIGMPVRIFVQAYVKTPFLGHVAKLGELLDPATRTIQVRIDLPNSRAQLKPEMYADAEIELGRGKPVLVVPAAAVQDLRGQSVVFVQSGPDRFEVRPIRTGKVLDQAYEIVSGLKSGDHVVVEAAFVLKSEFLKASLAGG